jgi:para-nitrobenzyl esterase
MTFIGSSLDLIAANLSRIPFRRAPRLPPRARGCTVNAASANRRREIKQGGIAMSKAGIQHGATRRDMFGGAALAAAAAAAPGFVETAVAQAPAAPVGLAGGADGEIFVVAKTASGKVQGIVNAGIKEFKGVPYGAPTGGRNRFMPPKKPASWTGVRNCIGYGPISPQTASDLRSEYSQLIMWDRHVGGGGMGEDCLTLNIWTPGVDQAKRAVMVSFHGGGWATGSGNGPMYDGANLARFGDVVVVTVNHRLAALGYLHLAGLGAPPEFANAGVCGLMDMVASLQWVRDNIASFGGDPDRVMIFGQSGGGSKTSTLLATPSAKGLFHRAAIQSGSTLRQQTPEQGVKSAELLLAKLGLAKNTLAGIQKLPWERILSAQIAAAAEGALFTPVIGGPVLPHHPFDPAAPPEAANVPVIISTTLEDAALRLTNFDLDEAGLRTILVKNYGAKADEILALYRKADPKKSPYLIQAQVLTDANGRRNAIIQGERRAAQNRAPTYMYIWEWATPAFDGKFGAVHGHDVDASFHLYRSPICGAGSAAGRRMVDRLSAAWVAFAKTGDPNNEKMPHWPSYDTTTRATMIFDDDTRVENDPRSEMRKLWAA